MVNIKEWAEAKQEELKEAKINDLARIEGFYLGAVKTLDALIEYLDQIESSDSGGKRNENKDVSKSK